MKVSSYSVEVTGSLHVLTVSIPAEDVSSAIEIVSRIKEIEVDTSEPAADKGKGKGAKGKPATKGKGAKKPKEPEPEEEDEDEDESDDEDDEDAADEDEDSDDGDDEDSDDEDEDADEDEDEAPAGKKGKGAAAASGSTKVKITPALKNAEKLRAVLVELMDQGLKSKKDILAACLALKTKLPALKPIKDLETRVPRAVELINPKIK